MRVLEIGDYPCLSRFIPELTDFYKIGKGASKGAPLTLGRVFELKKRLQAGHYDLVIYHLTTKAVAPWHRPAAWRWEIGDHRQPADADQ